LQVRYSPDNSDEVNIAFPILRKIIYSKEIRACIANQVLVLSDVSLTFML
jgi:hypothetical protein